MQLTGLEFRESVDYLANAWLPGRCIVEQALQHRHKVNSSGEIIRLSPYAPWKDHIFDLEEELHVNPPIKFCLYEVTRLPLSRPSCCLCDYSAYTQHDTAGFLLAVQCCWQLFCTCVPAVHAQSARGCMEAYIGWHAARRTQGRRHGGCRQCPFHLAVSQTACLCLQNGRASGMQSCLTSQVFQAVFLCMHLVSLAATGVMKVPCRWHSKLCSRRVMLMQSARGLGDRGSDGL